MPLCRFALSSHQSTSGCSWVNASLLAISLLGFAAGCGGSEQGLPSAAQSFLDAQAAIARGDNAAALTSLQAAIDADPKAVFAYMERVKLNARQGSDAAVEEDLQAILKIDPGNRDIGWIKAEMKKPAAERFDPNAKAPSASK
jgi:Tfp pilus assembly protein PilF